MLLKYTKFSEIPQFYCDGKLIGGLEILQSMHDNGTLLPVLLEGREHPDDYEKNKKKNKRKN